MTDESVFAAALAIDSPGERAAYLDRACAGNPAQRAEVEGLLAAHDGSNPLDRPPADLARTGDYEPAEGPPAAAVGDRVGPYRLMEQIGEGGFGLVFVAEQEEPVRRKVALKVLKPGMDTRDVVARFEAERQALALMDHPNIARVFDAGSTPQGRPFFVMELVRGVPITEFCDRHKLPPRDRLALFALVCRAVQHAHQKGVIHRDIKPSNVLVTSHDGVPVPKVIDFGVAKAVGQRLTDKTIYTRFAQMIGTPLYMSPEQAEMSGLDVDTRADVYALGVLLYELLTGTTPFGGERFRRAAFDEIRRIIREEEPPRPSARLTALGDTLTAVSAARGTDAGRLTGLVRGELDWITMKALEKDRNRRYESTAGLAKEVERYLAGEAVEACPPTLGYRLRKAYRRNRLAVLVGGAFAALVTVAAVTAGVLAVRATDAERSASRERDAARDAGRREGERADGERQAKLDAEGARDAAQKARDVARQAQYAAEVNLARDAWDGNRVALARDLLRRQLPAPGQADLRHFEWFYLDRLMNPTLTQWPVRKVLRLDQLSWSPDGSRLSVNGEARAYPSGAVALNLVRDLGTYEGGKPPPQTVGGYLHQYTRDGKWIVLDEKPAHIDSRFPSPFALHLADAKTGELKHRLPIDKDDLAEHQEFSQSADGARIALNSMERLYVWDTATGKPVLNAPRKYLEVLSPDGKHLARVVDGKGPGNIAIHQVELWRVDPFEKVRAFAVPTAFGDEMELVRFSPDGVSLAFVADPRWRSSGFFANKTSRANWQSHWVCVCRVSDGQPTWWLECDSAKISALAWDRESARLATGSADGAVRLWHWSSSVPVTLRGRRGAVHSLAFRPGDKTLAILDAVSGVTFWDVRADPAVRKVRPDGWVGAAEALADGGVYFAVFREDPKDKSERLEVVETETDRVLDSIPGTLRWPRRNGDTNEKATTVLVCPRGKRLVTLDPDMRLRVFSVAPGAAPTELRPSSPAVEKFDERPGWMRRPPALSPCGQYLLAYTPPSGPAIEPARPESWDGLAVWDLDRRERVLTIPSVHYYQRVVGFTHDGRLWVGSTWNAETQKYGPLRSAMWSLTRPDAPPEPCPDLPAGDVRAFHPQTGQVVLYSSDDQRAERDSMAVLDLTTGRERCRVPVAGTVAFSPDGKRLAALNWRDGNTGIRVWDTATGQELLQSFPLDSPEFGRRTYRKLTFAPDGRTLYLHRFDGLFAWDGAEPKK